MSSGPVKLYFRGFSKYLSDEELHKFFDAIAPVKKMYIDRSSEEPWGYVLLQSRDEVDAIRRFGRKGLILRGHFINLSLNRDFTPEFGRAQSSSEDSGDEEGKHGKYPPADAKFIHDPPEAIQGSHISNARASNAAAVESSTSSGASTSKAPLLSAPEEASGFAKAITPKKASYFPPPQALYRASVYRSPTRYNNPDNVALPFGLPFPGVRRPVPLRHPLGFDRRRGGRPPFRSLSFYRRISYAPDDIARFQQVEDPTGRGHFSPRRFISPRRYSQRYPHRPPVIRGPFGPGAFGHRPHYELGYTTYVVPVPQCSFEEPRPDFSSYYEAIYSNFVPIPESREILFPSDASSFSSSDIIYHLSNSSVELSEYSSETSVESESRKGTSTEKISEESLGLVKETENQLAEAIGGLRIVELVEDQAAAGGVTGIEQGLALNEGAVAVDPPGIKAEDEKKKGDQSVGSEVEKDPIGDSGAEPVKKTGE